VHRKFLRSHGDDALAHYHLGFAYGMTGCTRNEISEYLAAAGLGLRKWDLFLNLGLAYLSQNDGAKAINALQTAAFLDQIILKRISIWRLLMKGLTGCARLCWKLPHLSI
jgi:tetratricopeptide (TPR) repeat protein